MSDKSDYNYPRTKLHELLPEPYSSNANTALFENLFNRYLTKTESSKVSGYVGEGNTSALVSRQITEPSVARQAAQLQPVMYSKIGSVEHMMSWDDAMNELQRLGVDIDELPTWGQAQVFNWVPPVDLDKLINFQDYFWVGTDTPQYITIKNVANTLAAQLSFYQRLISEYGDLFTVVGIDMSSPLVDLPYDKLIVTGDFTSVFAEGFTLVVRDSTNTDINNTTMTVITSTYDTTNDQTSIQFEEAFTLPIADGVLSLQEQLATLESAVANQKSSTGVSPTVSSADQWIRTNQWTHRSNVDNFTTASQASIPIIEFDPDLELNEWTVTDHSWLYRTTLGETFEETSVEPPLIELIPFTYIASGSTLSLSDTIGNQTLTFTPGTVFETTSGQILEVSSSTFTSDGTQAFATTVEVTSIVTDVSGSIVPVITSQGSPWIGYDQHWVYSGRNTSTAVGHPTQNPYLSSTPSAVVTVSGAYDYTTTPFSQEFTATSNTEQYALSQTPSPGHSLALTKRAIIGQDDIRVYVNGVRSVGTYEELSESTLSPSTGADTSYVAGILFNTTQPVGTVITIEAGEAAFVDIGLSAISVRITTDDTVYDAAPNSATSLVSLTKNRKFEQVKTDTNQYPVYDIYNTDGSSAASASTLFEFQTDPSASVDGNTGKRIVIDAAGTNYTFAQQLLGPSSELLAYRNYTQPSAKYWVNPNAATVMFWNGYAWSQEGFQGTNNYQAVTVSDSQPSAVFDGQLWYSAATEILSEYTSGTFTEVTDVITSLGDPTLETIWRKGLKDEMYTPAKVDWKKRTQVEYETERASFVSEYADEQEGLVAWYSSQTHVLSPTGLWVGDWTIPDPLYYNNQHENYAEITSSQLLAHFASIIEAQPAQANLPAITGTSYHAISYEDINFGLGGKIHEYNSNVDTFLSSIFVNNVTPPTLLEFARDQYEVLVNSLRESIRDEVYDMMLNTEADTLIDTSNKISELVISNFEQNDNNSLIYGDSTSFIDNTGTNDLGIKNWIATLPFLNLATVTTPHHIVDPVLGVNQIIHHDGHRRDYEIAPTTIDGIALRVLTAIDSRSTLSAPNNTFGIQSSTTPSLTTQDFTADYGESITNREGVFWYHITADARTLYRLTVAAVGTIQPSATLPDNTLWMDMSVGNGTLRIKTGLDWEVVTQPTGSTLVEGDGMLHNGTDPTDITTSTISAWQVFDINAIVASTILQVEEKLVESSPINSKLSFDLDSLMTTTSDISTRLSLLQIQFLDYVKQSEISTPFQNVTYALDDAFSWNYKRSAPGQSFNIVTASSSSNTITIEGLHASSFTSPSSIFVKNSSTIDGTLTVTSATELANQTVLTVSESVQNSTGGIAYQGTLPTEANTGAESAADYRGLYTQVYGTPYPHLEPWILQGYANKPTWWTTEYADTTGSRIWEYDHDTTEGMWTNILQGIVPAGYTLPDGITIATGAVAEVPSYEYVSVDLTSDNLLPPYYDHVSAGTTFRSIFSNLDEIVSPAADYSFGDQSPVEVDWMMSTHYAYDLLTVAYIMRPQEFIANTFGFEYNVIGGLNIDKLTNQAPSHTRTTFHGEILTDGTVHKVSGLNQLYVNYNRYQGFDSSLSDFRSLWTEWTAPLTYQFSSFVGTESFELGHRTVPLSSSDYKIASKRSPGVEDYWLNAFDVSVLSVPPVIQRYDNEHEWSFELNINSPLTQNIEYYDVQRYQFLPNMTSSVCEIYKYNIQSIDSFNDEITVIGDQTSAFTSSQIVTITESSHNDNEYVVAGSTYDATTDTTLVTLTTSVDATTVDGYITSNYRTLPWETGDSIWLTTDDTLPAPMHDAQPGIGLIQYFIIMLSDTTFQIANTKQNALDGLQIELTSIGVKNSYVGKIHSTFRALDAARTGNIWKHYKLDITNLLSITPPDTIRGMQSIVNIIDGYSARMEEVGFRINDSRSYVDPDTGRLVDWQVELERFIDSAYELQGRKDVNIGNRFSATINTDDNMWTWGEYAPAFATGDPVKVMSTTGNQPSPILTGVRYFIIADSPTQFRLANTRRQAILGTAIDVTTSPIDTTLTIHRAAESQNVFPSLEINPFRNAIYFNPTRGIVTNMSTGPSEDIRNTQLLFDQYGRPLDRSHSRLYRQDLQTYIQCKDGIVNNVLPSFISDDPYNYIHFGGAHIFVDAYEHVLIFNNETTESALIYDPFIGLNITKFELLFDRQGDFTSRPNVGGSYFKTNNNQDAELKGNFETSVDALRKLYDVHDSSETSKLSTQARKSLGYGESQDYLSDINLNDKSQFLFWRGLIQNKGSVESINAFVNSRRFIDASVDEFWAYKVAEYGATADKEYPEMFLTTDDVTTNNFRIQFAESGEVIPGYGLGGFSGIGTGYDASDAIVTTQEGVTSVSPSDTDRWYNQPDVLTELTNNGSALHFDLEVTNNIDIDTDDIDTDTLYYRHNFASDFESITVQTLAAGTVEQVPHTAGQTILTLPTTYFPYANHISIFKNGSEMSNPTDYEEVGGLAGSFTSQSIVLTTPSTSTDVIEVVYSTATLASGRHFNHITSNIIQFNDASVLTNDYVSMTLWAYRVNSAAQNPAKLIDRSSNTIVTSIPLWDPARGLHYHIPTTIIDITSEIDPATYNQTIASENVSLPLNVSQWSAPEVGTVWHDSSKLGYVPYYDFMIFTDEEEQLNVWGQQADWSEVKLYEWVESDVPPEEYAALSLIEEGDSEIPEHVRKSGQPRQTIFEFVDDTWSAVVDNHQEFIPADGVIVADEARSYTFTLDVDTLKLRGDPLVNPDYVAVYVNGTIRTSDTGIGFEVPPEYTIVIKDLSITDSIRIINYAPSLTDLDAELDAGTMVQQYEHTTVDYIDAQHQTQTKYYFWVENKVTKNQSQAISPVDAQHQLATIPTPYMITTNVAQAEQRFASTESVTRSWQYVLAVEDLTTATAQQILGQSQDDFNQTTSASNGTFTGGEDDLSTGYAPGDVITMTSGVVVDVLSVGLNGNVTAFNITYAAPSTTVSTATYFQQGSATTSSGGVSDGQGFRLSLGTNNINATTHSIVLGSNITNQGKKSSLVVEDSAETTFTTAFSGGDGQAITSSTFTPRSLPEEPGDVITLSNGAEILVTAIDASGDVAEFDVLTSGDSFVVGTTLTQDFVTPTRTTSNTGFRLDTSPATVDVSIDDTLVTVSSNGRVLTPDSEFTIDDTGRVITINQSVGAVEYTTIAIEYTTTQPTEIYDLPNRHTDIIIRGLNRYVTEDRRFTMRFTRDFTLRHNSVTSQKSLSLKNNHEEWTLIRQNQLSKISRDLWDRITESMVGYKLLEPTTRVPQLSRTLYDTLYNTDTQYGLGDRQSFTNGPAAIATIQLELMHEILSDVDLDSFYSSYNFNNTDNIVTAMDAIYDTFSTSDVNRLFFVILHDAFSYKSEFAELFKTSMIAVHGIRPFQTTELFDD